MLNVERSAQITLCTRSKVRDRECDERYTVMHVMRWRSTPRFHAYTQASSTLISNSAEQLVLKIPRDEFWGSQLSQTKGLEARVTNCISSISCGQARIGS
jgi:hypothetical protein